MLINILKSITSENDCNKISSLLITLQDVVGGNISDWFEKNDLYSVWNNMTETERTTELQSFINNALTTGMVNDIVENPEEELNTYDVEILVVEWNKYHISLKATSLEMATRIAQAQGPFRHEDDSLNYTSELIEAATKSYYEGDSIDYFVEDARIRKSI